MAADTTYADTLGPDARETFAELCDSLPKKPNDTEEAVAARARRAMETIVALNPEDALEARLAVRVVTMDAHAADCLRAAVLATGDAAEVNRCRTRAASMARLSDAALRTLRRMRAERDKAYNEMHPAAMGRAGYWFKEVSVPAPDHVPGPKPQPSPAPDYDPGPAAGAEPERTPATIETDAKLYAAMYPDRVRRIRAAHGLPPDLDFGPPEPEIVEALLRGTNGVSASAT